MLIFICALLEHMRTCWGCHEYKEAFGPNNLILDITGHQRITERCCKPLVPWLSSRLLLQPYSLFQRVPPLPSAAWQAKVALCSLFPPHHLLIAYGETNGFPPHISFSNNFSTRYIFKPAPSCFPSLLLRTPTHLIFLLQIPP